MLMLSYQHDALKSLNALASYLRMLRYCELAASSTKKKAESNSKEREKDTAQVADAGAASACAPAGAAEETGRHPNAFNPWGFGVRACIGSQFALWEAKIFLAMVLRCFK